MPPPRVVNNPVIVFVKCPPSIAIVKNISDGIAMSFIGGIECFLFQ